jgi:4,5-DOPA dioxygenase extradiol
MTSTLQQLSAWSHSLVDTPTMPVIFAGHGSPMNAIQDTVFSRQWRAIGQTLSQQPTAILCISAHWLTQGSTAVTAMQQPATIHDFGGFPQQLFAVQYPAQGSPALVQATIDSIQSRQLQADLSWGLDHGSWSVLLHMFPKANVPVVQMSIDYQMHAQQHYDLAKELAGLRRKGVLIIASGNTVHNLRLLSRDHPQAESFGYDWAIEADQTIQGHWLNHHHQALIDWQQQGRAFQLAIPTPDHYYPMLYALGLQTANDELSIFNQGTTMGALNMSSFILKPAA